tara:strand:+ start:2605 stop:2859 length:255 start_codon:yes stop_codon:yes gene_type:complete
MGRAIEIEKKVTKLEEEVKYLKRVTRGLSSTMVEVEEVLFKEDKKSKKEKKTDGKKETNNEGNDKSSVKPNKRKANPVAKTSKS